MDTIAEPERKIPVSGRYDVLVGGGGVAGIGAAVAAARNQAKILLIERYGYLGGLATGGLVLPLPVPPKGSPRGHGGIMQEVIDRLEGAGELCRTQSGDCFSNPEAIKLVCQEILEESDVELLLDTLVVGAIKDGYTVRGVIAENKSGRQAILAKVTVDATGDADIAALAGAPFMKRSREEMLPITMMYVVGNVDEEKFREYETKDPGLRKASEKAGFIYSSWLGGKVQRGPSMRHMSGLMKGMMLVWGGAVKYDGSNAKELTSAWLELRKQVAAEVAFLRRYVPGFESCHIIQTSPYVGVRETRRIVGEYVLTEDELKGKRFEDTVFYNGTYDLCIPYRSLVPKKIDNLLAAGRCVYAGETGRGIISCMAMGQAAGTAAALSAKTGVKPRDLDVKALKKTLCEQSFCVDRE